MQKQENQRGGVLQEHEPGQDELCTVETVPIPIVLSEDLQLGKGDNPLLSISQWKVQMQWEKERKMEEFRKVDRG